MKMARLLLLLLCVAILPGCATVGLKNGPEHFGKALDLTVRPEQSLGVRVTPALENGNVTVFDLPITDSQFGGEMYPGRIMFPGMVTNEKGEEFFAQSVLAGIYPSGEFMSFVIVDGKLVDMKGAKFLPLSSRTDYFWNEDGEAIPLDRQKFYAEEDYRKKMILEKGLSIGSRRMIKGFDKIVKSWNRYSTSYGDIYSPLGEEDIKRIAKINPGYSPVEKLVLRNRAVISINPVETIAKAFITLIEASNGKSQGWDYTSELPTRQQMAAIVEFIGRFRLKLVRELNEKVAQQEKGGAS